VENFNSASKDLFYGKAGDLTGDDRENVEVSALALHLIAAAGGRHSPLRTPAEPTRLAPACVPFFLPGVGTIDF
jgi:hypothetical protein